MQSKTISCVFFTCFVILCSSQQQAFAQKIYLLTAADTKDHNIGISDEKDMTNIYQAFWSQVPEEQLVLYNQSNSWPNPPTWKGPELQQDGDMKNAILEAISRCPAGPNDTIVFYWSGHGAFDSQGHYLKMPNNVPLYRKDVVAAIKRKSPRLAVVISDSCNTMFESRDLRTEVPSPAMEPAMVISPLFDSLFICHKGLVDINASSKGEEARCTPTYGGLFTGTLAFAEEKLEMRGGEERPTGRGIDVEVKNTFGWPTQKELPLGYFGTHAHKREDWNDLVAYVNRTIKKHWSWKTQQKVRVWSLPHKLTPHRQNRNGSGIPSVLSLTRNDVILSINGEKIYDEDDCRRAIRVSGKIMEFTVRDGRDGTIWRMQSRLQNSKPRFGVYLDDARGGGALVTNTRFGSPATNNRVLGKVDSGNYSGNDHRQPQAIQPPRGNSPRTLSLSRGDVILSVNGQRVSGRSDCIRKVNNSPNQMTFTVRDNRNGTVWRMQTDLQGGKFGINLRDAQGGGAYVTSVSAGYPATKNRVLERVSSGN